MLIGRQTRLFPDELDAYTCCASTSTLVTCLAASVAATGKSGALNTLSDVFTLCAFVRNSWAALEGASGLTLAEIDATELLAEEAHTALSHKPHERKDIAKLADLRRRVFTLFFNAYDEARRGVAYLRWKEGDADEIAPSLLRGRGKRKAEEAAAEAAAPVVTAPLPWEEQPRAET